MPENNTSSKNVDFKTAQLIDAFPHPLLVIDPKNYTVIQANTAANPQDKKGETCYSLLHGRSSPCTADNLSCPIEEIKKTNKPARMEYIHFDKKGTEKTVEVNAYPILDKKGRFFRMIESCVDISARKREEEQFRALLTRTEESVGWDFFDGIVDDLQQWFGVDCVIIGELTDNDHVKALAMMLDGELIHEYSYPLAGSPFEKIREKGFCLFNEGIIHKFPRDKKLKELNAESYMGIPLRGRGGAAIGVLCVVSRRKLEPPSNVQELFEIIAAKASAEIEHKKLLDELKTSEQRFRTILDTVGEGIITIGRDSRITLVNNELCAIFGYSEEELLGKDLAMLMPKKYRQAHKKGLKKYLKSGEARILGKRIEIEGLRKDGTLFPIEMRVEETKDEHSRFFSAAIRDLTTRKEAEKALKESEEIFRTLVQSINGYLYSIRYKEGNIQSVYRSPQCEIITGYTSKEYERDPYLWINMVHEEDRKRVGRFFSDIEQLRTRKPIEHRIVHKNGKIVWVLNYCTLTLNDEGKLLRTDGLIIDITDRKDEGEMLEILTHDLGERVKELNCLYGISKLVNKKNTTLDDILLGAVELIPLAMQYSPITCAKIVFEGREFDTDNCGKASWKLSAPIKVGGKKIGHIIIAYLDGVLEFEGNPFLKDEKRLIEGIAAQIGIIIEEKKAESALIKAKEEAESATRLKDKFVSLVSHDLRRPLTTISGYTQLLCESDNNAEPDKSILQEIVASCNDMSVLISDILNLGKIRQGVIKPAPSFCDARTMAIHIIGRHLTAARRKGLTLINEIPKRTRIYADERLFHEVLDNIVANAVKFCRENDEIRLFVPKGEASTIAVGDTGIGIEKVRLKNLFKYEESTSTRGTDGETGTGFGLPLASEIVAAHGGEIKIESSPGEGTTFHVIMPHVRPRILIVDDEKHIIDIIKEILKAVDADFIEALDGRSALKIIEENPPHLILLDIILPDMSGLDLLKELKSREEEEDIPVIVITGAPNFDDQGNIFHFGAADFIRKPFDHDDLIQRVNRFI